VLPWLAQRAYARVDERRPDHRPADPRRSILSASPGIVTVMTTVVLFHSVLGVRRGELDAADRLRAGGHDVLVPDLYDGRVFDV